MLRTPPHPAEPAHRTERLLGAALTALHAAGLDSQIRWQRPGLSTGPTSKEATP
jgi:hypothetical protein